jgi:hypothetical protein
MNIKEELARLGRMTTGELAGRYIEVCGEPARTRNRSYLMRKITWRLQAKAEGDLSERARRRAAELADIAEARVMPPKHLPSAGEAQPAAAGTTVTVPVQQDPRLPSIGTELVKHYKGQTLHVIVQTKGFEFEGKLFRTLSAVAKHISGTHINGFRFFGLGGDQ